MTESNVTLPDNLQVRLRAHLDAVDRVLADQDVSASRRRSVRDDLNSHILDILHQRSPLNPCLPDLEAVLAQLDPPESYRDDPDQSAAPQPSPQGTGPSRSPLSKLAIAAGICIPSGIVLAGLTFGLALALAHIARRPWFEQTAPLAAWIVLGTIWSAGTMLNLIVIASSSGPQGSRWRSLGSHSKIIILGLLALSVILAKSLNMSQDLGFSLPLVIRLLLHIPLPVYLILLVYLIAAVVAKDLICQTLSLRKTLNILFASLATLLAATYLTSLFLILHNLATGMGNPSNP